VSVARAAISLGGYIEYLWRKRERREGTGHIVRIK